MSEVSDSQDLNQFENATKLMQQNQFNEAKTLLLQLLEKNPTNPAVQHKLGEIYLAVDQLDVALQYIMSAVQNEPNNGYYVYRLGYTMLKMGHVDQAIKSLDLAVRIDPGLSEPYPLLGTLYQGLGKENEALKCYLAKADVLNIPEIFEAVAKIYQQQEQFDKAHAYYRKALETMPSMSSAQIGLASMLVDRMVKDCRYDAEEAATIRQLCQQQQKGGTVVRTLANLECIEGNSAVAIDHYREALALQPDDKNVRGNLAITLLRSGHYLEGWSYLRWRQDFSNHDFGFISQEIAGVSAPQWTGEQYAGMTLLVTSEQGVGDQILHVQHLLPLMEVGIKLILTCNVKLVTLFRRSFPQIKVLPDNEPVPSALSSHINFQVFLLDVPYFAKLNPSDYQAPNGYLKADPMLVEQFRQDVNCTHIKQPHTEQPQCSITIGIAWSSSSGSSGPSKSIVLEKLMPLLELPHCHFISIQYGDAVEDARALNQHRPSLVTIDESFNPFDDLEKAAAQIAALDLVIAVSNAAVHMAGALGIQTWVLAQYVPLWHWFEAREDSPWYPTVRLFRQSTHNDWDSVVQRVIGELQKLTAEPD